MTENTQLRAIVAKRLSHTTGSTTHLVTETETIGEFVTRNNIKVWAEAEDLDVSGGKPIRERPKIGKLLALEHLDEWDVLILYKLDRGFRNHLDFVTFYHEYCERYGKKIISVGEEGIDMSTPMGRMFAGFLVQFAEWELQTISERRTRAMDVMRREARYPGGPYPFGYEPYQEGAYWYLRPHPVYAKVVVEMALALVSGKSTTSIANDLNARGIPTIKSQLAGPSSKKKYVWTTSTVRYILSSEHIRGYVLHSEDWNHVPPVRVVGADGEFVRREPLIDDELWFKVQDVLAAHSKPKSGIRFKASLLLRVGFCGYCGGALHQLHRTFPVSKKFPEGKTYRYYACQNRRSDLKDTPLMCRELGSVPMDALDAAVSAKLLEVLGHYELTEKRVIEGADHSAALKKLGVQIADLTTQHYVENGVPDFHKRMSELEAEHSRVSALPREKPRVRRISTGKTFRQHWEEMDNEQRHTYLTSAGISALVVRKEDYTTGMVPEQRTETADDGILDIPMSLVTPVGDKWVANISIGALREQLQQAASPEHRQKIEDHLEGTRSLGIGG